jgi:hypothetical protein
VKLTREDARNGWTPEKLEQYRKQRDEQAVARIFTPPKLEPQMQNTDTYDPHKY